MAFSTLTFLFFFLPAALLVYYAVPFRFRNGMLALLGLLFCALGGGAAGAAAAVLLAVDSFCVGLLIARSRRTWVRRVWLGVGLAVAAAVALALRVELPWPAVIREGLGRVGMSFSVLLAVSYLVDVYRRTADACGNPLSCAGYVLLFPLLPAGPVLSFAEAQPMLRSRVQTIGGMTDGVSRFLTGLAKKVLLADGLGRLCEAALVQDAASLPAATAWLALLAYAFRICLELWGYADMAVGLGGLLGFSLPENFRFPYRSGSLREFWGRWNITLGQWFSRYLYAPLAGRQERLFRRIPAVLITALLMGLWYGAGWNFLLWGLWMGGLLLVEELVLDRFLPKRNSFLWTWLTFGAVLVGWVFFLTDSPSAAAGCLSALFGGSGQWADERTLYLLLSHLPVLVLSGLCLAGLPYRIADRIRSRGPRLWEGAGMVWRLLLLGACVCVLVLQESLPLPYYGL